MAIMQTDPKRPNEAVTINPANPNRIQVSPFPYFGGNTAPATIDATPFQGGPLRVYLDPDGSISTDLYRDHYWLLAEAILPERRYENQPTGQVDENGQPMMAMVELPLDLNDVEIIVFPLPEVV